jgi:hypothetical protein
MSVPARSPSQNTSTQSKAECLSLSTRIAVTSASFGVTAHAQCSSFACTTETFGSTSVSFTGTSVV